MRKTERTFSLAMLALLTGVCVGNLRCGGRTGGTKSVAETAFAALFAPKVLSATQEMAAPGTVGDVSVVASDSSLAGRNIKSVNWDITAVLKAGGERKLVIPQNFTPLQLDFVNNRLFEASALRITGTAVGAESPGLPGELTGDIETFEFTLPIANVNAVAVTTALQAHPVFPGLQLQVSRALVAANSTDAVVFDAVAKDDAGNVTKTIFTGQNLGNDTAKSGVALDPAVDKFVDVTVRTPDPLPPGQILEFPNKTFRVPVAASTGTTTPIGFTGG